jgi:hypothetical protein
MVHVPIATRVTVAPDTVQTPVVRELKLTVRPEVALALRANGGELSGWFGRAAKLIVWLAFDIVKLRLTAVAAA